LFGGSALFCTAFCLRGCDVLFYIPIVHVELGFGRSYFFSSLSQRCHLSKYLLLRVLSQGSVTIPSLTFILEGFCNSTVSSPRLTRQVGQLRNFFIHSSLVLDDTAMRSLQRCVKLAEYLMSDALIVYMSIIDALRDITRPSPKVHMKGSAVTS
jgi:hypothetical protein